MERKVIISMNLVYPFRCKFDIYSKNMIGTRRRQDITSSSMCSTCTSVSSNTRWSDISGSVFSPALLSPPRPIIKSAHRFIIPLIPPAWSPISHLSPQATLRDFCLPRQEPRPPADVLNRSSLSSCSPSLAKFSRTINSTIVQNVSIATSTTTLPSAINTGTFRHPTMSYLTVNGLKTHHRPPPHHHHHHCRHTR
jgi:hypothetical protein